MQFLKLPSLDLNIFFGKKKKKKGSMNKHETTLNIKSKCIQATI